MMKKVKKIPFILAIVFLLGCIPAGIKTDAAVVNSSENTTDEQFLFFDKCNDEYALLMDYWGEYPEYYGGAYIENGHFYINLTDTSPQFTDPIYQVTGDHDIIINKVRYSYNELETLRSAIEAVIFDMDKREENVLMKAFVGLGVDEVKNRVIVEVLKQSANKQFIRDTLGDDPRICIIYKKEGYTSHTAISAGYDKWIRNNTLMVDSTIACCGTSINNLGQPEYGVVIAGHAGNLYDTMSIEGYNIGTVSSRSFGGTMDAAFVHLNSSCSYVRSKLLSQNYTIDGYSSVGIVGSSYSMHGMSSGIIGATVDNTNFSFVMDNTGFSGMIRCRMMATAGDSGGPLVKQVSQSGGTSRLIVGIYSGGDSTYGNFTKYTLFRTAFNFTLYQ